MSNKYELREWLSLAPADFPVWGAGGCIIAMMYIKNLYIDWTLGILAVALTIVSCFIGLKYDDRISNFSNVVRRVSYPLCVLGAIVAVYINFTMWQ